MTTSKSGLIVVWTHRVICSLLGFCSTLSNTNLIPQKKSYLIEIITEVVPGARLELARQCNPTQDFKSYAKKTYLVILTKQFKVAARFWSSCGLYRNVLTRPFGLFPGVTV